MYNNKNPIIEILDLEKELITTLENFNLPEVIVKNLFRIEDTKILIVGTTNLINIKFYIVDLLKKKHHEINQYEKIYTTSDHVMYHESKIYIQCVF